MTELNSELSEYVKQLDLAYAESFPKRLTRKQKTPFLERIESELESSGFETERLTLGRIPKNELLLTRCDHPEFIFTAHYDTPTIMPAHLNFVAKITGHTRLIFSSIASIIATLLLMTLLNALFGILLQLLGLTNWVFEFNGPILVALLLFSPLFIPNPSNREDNTSGVIGLLTLARWLSDKPDLRSKVQFVFFDNEELGLLGSSALRRHWDKHRFPYKNASIINLDCVSRGTLPLIIHHRNDSVGARVLPCVRAEFPSTKLFNSRWTPLSDNYPFRHVGAIDISFAEPSIVPGGYFIPKIHTPRDNNFSAESLTRLVYALSQFLLRSDDSQLPVDALG